MAADAGLPAKLLGEFLGTFLLVFTVGCNVLSGNSVWGGVSIASVLMVAIYALGGISGANFNPAVSLSLGVAKLLGGPGLDLVTMTLYMCMQVLGGVSAAAAYSLLFAASFDLGPSAGHSMTSAGSCELLYTCMLCFVVLNVAAAERSGNSPNQFFGLAIGSVIVAGAYGAGAVSGGAFNPAVAIGIDVSSFEKGFGNCFLYTGWELVGAVVATILFRVVRPADFHQGEKTLVSDLVSEFLGTYFLVLTVGLNVISKSAAGAYSIGASLMAMVYALGNVSGAHFNPAVTTAVFLSGRDANLSVTRVALYWVAQLCGGIGAGITYWSLLGRSFQVAPGSGFGLSQAAVAESMFTFLLCYIVLSVAASSTTKSATFFGLAIGFCIVVGGNAIGHISGGCLNPAVALGAAAANAIEGGSLVYATYWTAFELCGAAVAAGMFHITHAVDKCKEG